MINWFKSLSLGQQVALSAGAGAVVGGAMVGIYDRGYIGDGIQWVREKLPEPKVQVKAKKDK